MGVGAGSWRGYGTSQVTREVTWTFAGSMGDQATPFPCGQRGGAGSYKCHRSHIQDAHLWRLKLAAPEAAPFPDAAAVRVAAVVVRKVGGGGCAIILHTPGRTNRNTEQHGEPMTHGHAHRPSHRTNHAQGHRESHRLPFFHTSTRASPSPAQLRTPLLDQGTRAGHKR